MSGWRTGWSRRMRMFRFRWPMGRTHRHITPRVPELERGSLIPQEKLLRVGRCGSRPRQRLQEQRRLCDTSGALETEREPLDVVCGTHFMMLKGRCGITREGFACCYGRWTLMDGAVGLTNQLSRRGYCCLRFGWMQWNRESGSATSKVRI